MKSDFAIITLVFLLSGCAASDFRDVRSASLKLQLGMTEAEAINVVGSPPDTAELGTCGADTKEGGWTCRTLTFQNAFDLHRLIVHEALVDKAWRVSSWHTF